MNVPFQDPPPLQESFRAKVDHRVATRRRNRRVATASLVAAVAVVALTTALTVAAQRDQAVHTVDHRHPVTTAVVEAAPTTSTVPPSTTTTAPATTVPDATPTTLIAGTPVTYGHATLIAPPGWSAKHDSSQTIYRSVQCIAPDDTAGLLDIYGCQGILVFQLRPSGGSPRNSSGSTPDQVDWASQTGADCPFTDAYPVKGKGTGTSTSTTTNRSTPVTSPLLVGVGTRVDSGYRPVGDRTAAWASFDVSCNVGPVHHIQVWVLPDSKVGFESVSTDSEVAAILTSVRITP